MGAIIYSFNVNISPKMSRGVLWCDIVRLQNSMLTIFVRKDFVIKGALFVPDFVCLKLLRASL